MRENFRVKMRIDGSLLTPRPIYMKLALIRIQKALKSPSSGLYS